MTGLELLRAARPVRGDAVGIILTAFTDVDVLIESINVGQIYRYITKPWDGKEVRGILQQAIERHHLFRENTRLEEQLRQYTGYLNQELHGRFDFGASSATRRCCATCSRASSRSARPPRRCSSAARPAPARSSSRAPSTQLARRDGPFVRVNCAALARGAPRERALRPREGRVHRRDARRRGASSWPSGGTLFLDEIGEHAARTAGQAPARAAGARVRARRRHRDASRSTCASSRRRTGISRR